jgi:DNA (cytosine-5)-methyltransferase 1
MSVYYNESKPYLAAWLRNLIAAGLLPDGVVDDRSIVDVRAADLEGFTQHHFFAGIGGWPHALRLVGWPVAKPVWTGSPPCQPLSVGGRRQGHADERHLWPAFFDLIAQRKPSIIFGEQVARGDGREWFAGVRADLEGAGYAVGAADLCAAGVQAPHDRPRIYSVAHANPEYVAAGAGCQRHRYAPGWDARYCQHAIHCAPNFWTPYTALERRRLKPGVQLLVDGFPGRLAQLHAAGNAILPQLAAEFIIAASEAINDQR